MFQEIDNVVGGNITGTMTTVEVRLSNACGRIERDVYRRLCYACVAPVTFEFVPADFDLCQPFPLCARTTFSWDNCGNLLTEGSLRYQIFMRSETRIESSIFHFLFHEENSNSSVSPERFALFLRNFFKNWNWGTRERSRISDFNCTTKRMKCAIFFPPWATTQANLFSGKNEIQLRLRRAGIVVIMNTDRWKMCF